MATGKGVLWSPSAENRRRLSESERGWGRKPVLLEKTNRLGSETALGGSSQDEACAEMVLSVAPGKLRLGKLMPQKTWWTSRADQEIGVFRHVAIPVHHQLPEFTQTHVHQVGDAMQPSHLLLSPSPPTLNLSQHQSLFQ